MCWDSEQQDASNKIKRWLPRLPHKSSLSPDTITDLWHLNCFLSKILVFVAVLFTGTLLYWIIVCCPKTVSSIITILMTLIVWRLETPHCTVSTALQPHPASTVKALYSLNIPSVWGQVESWPYQPTNNEPWPKDLCTLQRPGVVYSMNSKASRCVKGIRPHERVQFSESRSTLYLVSFYKSWTGISLALNYLIWSWSEIAINQLEEKRISCWTNKILYQEMLSCCPLVAYFQNIVQAFNIHEEDSSSKLISSSINSQVLHEKQGVQFAIDNMTIDMGKYYAFPLPAFVTTQLTSP